MPFCLPAGVHTPTVVVHVVCYDVPLGEVGWNAQHMLLRHPFVARHPVDALSLAVCNAHLQQPVPRGVLATLPQRRRRLAEATKADLVVTIEYLGTLEGGNAIVDACAANNCTGGNAEFLGGTAQSGAVDTLPVASIALVQVSTAPGEPYMFRTTYTVGGVPATAFATLTAQEEGSMSCSRVREEPGVDLFTCRPLKALGLLTVTAFGLVPAAGLGPEGRVHASIILTNTSALASGFSSSVDHQQAFLPGFLAGHQACAAAPAGVCC